MTSENSILPGYSPEPTKNSREGHNIKVGRIHTPHTPFILVLLLMYLNINMKSEHVWLTKLLQWESSVLSEGKCWNRSWSVHSWHTLRVRLGHRMVLGNWHFIWCSEVFIKWKRVSYLWPLWSQIGNNQDPSQPRPFPTSSPLSMIMIWCSESIPGVGLRIVGLWNTLAVGNQVNFVERISLTLKPK